MVAGWWLIGGLLVLCLALTAVRELSLADLSLLGYCVIYGCLLLGITSGWLVWPHLQWWGLVVGIVAGAADLFAMMRFSSWLHCRL